MEEARTVFIAAEIIRTGHATGNVARFPVKSRLPQAEDALEGISTQPIHSVRLNQREGQKVTIFGTEILLGPAVLFCERTYITKRDLSKLKTAIAKAKPDDVISYSIKPYKGCPTNARYLNWLPPAEAEELRRLPIFDNSIQAGDSSGTPAAD